MSIALIDLVWIGTFANSDYVVPIDEPQRQVAISQDVRLDEL